MGKHAGSPQSLQIFVWDVVICSADSPRLNILMMEKRNTNSTTGLWSNTAKEESDYSFASHGSPFFLYSWTRMLPPQCWVYSVCARLHQLVTWRLCAHGATWRPASSTWRVTHQQQCRLSGVVNEHRKWLWVKKKRCRGFFAHLMRLFQTCLNETPLHHTATFWTRCCLTV